MNSNGNGCRMPVAPRHPMKPNGQGVHVGLLTISIAVGTMVTIAFLLCQLSVLMSPKLLRRIVMQSREISNFSYVDSLPDGRFMRGRQDHAVVSPATASSTSLSNGLESLQRESGEKNSTSTASKKKFSILIGIMTMAKKTERRNLLRLAYGVQSSEHADVTVKFVLGKLQDGTDGTMVEFEKKVHGDIMELEVEENMNNGKSFHYFTAVASGDTQYDYVMKTDDDSYVRIDNLGKHLLPLSRTDLYYGYILPCENQDPYKWYMAGMGYLISWDLVQWIKDSPIPRRNISGTEDKLVGGWFDEGGKAKNRVNDKPLFYDHPEFGGKCAHELIPDTILVHQVKTPERWAHVLSYFEKNRSTAVASS